MILFHQIFKPSRRKLQYFSLFVVLVVFFVSVRKIPLPIREFKLLFVEEWVEETIPKTLLINTSNYQIPDFHPWDRAVLRYLKVPYILRCSPNPPLTTITSCRATVNSENSSQWLRSEVTEQNLTITPAVLRFHKERISHYTEDAQLKVMCCYREIRRIHQSILNYTSEADDLYKFSDDCTRIKSKMTMFQRSTALYVICKDEENEEVYKNIHYIIGCEKISFKERRMKTNNIGKNSVFQDMGSYNKDFPNPDSNKLSVAIVGIDSTSRLNFKRYLSNAYSLLNKYGAIDLQGYSKVGLNTYPNIIPLLTGLPHTDILHAAKPHDNVPFIWKNFSRNNYVTIYSEDRPGISTFHYHKLGFVQQPTDFYLRSVMQASEKFLAPTSYVDDYFCFGNRNVVEVMVDYVLDFARTFWLQPWFGHFWTTGLTHTNPEYATTAEESLISMIKAYYEEPVFNNTVIFLISDHGLRFGRYREETIMGKYEDSLPFHFILLPSWFSKVYPKAYKNLRINENRLTTVYDVHETLSDILHSNYGTDNRLSSNGNGISLFNEIPSSRSCRSAHIPEMFCVGDVFEYVKDNVTIVDQAMKMMFKKINTLMMPFKQCVQFNKYVIKSVLKITPKFQMVDNKIGDAKSIINYAVHFTLFPGEGIFEATIKYVSNTEFILPDDISRLNMYGNQSHCINSSFYNRICYCKDML